MKYWLLWKDPDAGKDRRREEKGTTEDEMVGWHHRLNGHEWVNSGSWWWSGMLQSVGSQSWTGLSDWTQLNWTSTLLLWYCEIVFRNLVVLVKMFLDFISLDFIFAVGIGEWKGRDGKWCEYSNIWILLRINRTNIAKLL